MAKRSRSPDVRRRRSRSKSSFDDSSSDDDYKHTNSRRRKSKRSRSRNRSKDSRSKSKSSFRESPENYKRRHHHRSRSRSKSKSRSTKEKKVLTDKLKGPPTSHSTAAENLTPEEQLKTKMQMALKAAAEADAALREKGVFVSNKSSTCATKHTAAPAPENLTVQEQINRSQTIDAINAPGFFPQEFLGNQSGKLTNSSNQSNITDTFGTEVKHSKPTSAAIGKLVPNELVHENLFANMEFRQEKWVRKLYSMRQKRLNGDIMS